MNKEKSRDIESGMIQGLRKRDHESLKLVYKSYYPVIESLVIRNNGSEFEAKDVFQESVILLYEKLQKPDFQLTCSIKTFLYAISKRLWLKKWNEKKIKIYDTRFENEPDILDDLFQNREMEEHNYIKMQNALVLLGEPCATILQDFYLHDLSMIEISEKFGYTNPENAKNQKYKCLQRLKKLFFETDRT